MLGALGRAQRQLSELEGTWSQAGEVPDVYEALTLTIERLVTEIDRGGAAAGESDNQGGGNDLWANLDASMRSSAELMRLEVDAPATQPRKALLQAMAITRDSMWQSAALLSRWAAGGGDQLKASITQGIASTRRKLAALRGAQKQFSPSQVRALKNWATSNQAFAAGVGDALKGDGEIGIGGLKARVQAVRSALSRVSASHYGNLGSHHASLNSAQGEVGGLLAIVLVVCLLLCGLLGWMLTRSIRRPLEVIVSQMSAGAVRVGNASLEIAQSGRKIADGANIQAASLEDVSSSLEEMSSLTKENADNAKQANTMAAEARDDARSAQDAMQGMSDAISRIKASSEETAKIVKTIDEIAFQTNLLALNAAVEAARAGDAGKGFAVVADEVRNLAQRSAESARDTALLIEGSQRNAESGVHASSEVEGMVTRIAQGIEKVTEIMGWVAAASQEQAHGLEQINVAVAEMDRITQSSASNAHETAGASQDLGEHAGDLHRLVDLLKNAIGWGDNADAMHLLGTESTALATGSSYGGGDMGGGNGGGDGLDLVYGPDNSDMELSAKQAIPLDDDELKNF